MTACSGEWAFDPVPELDEAGSVDYPHAAAGIEPAC